MTTPLSNNPLFPSSETFVEPNYDPLAIQIGLLEDSLKNPCLSSKTLQGNCQNTILLCLYLNDCDKAIDLLNKVENENVYADNLEGKANLHASLIKKLVEIGLHAKADEVFKSANSKGVWENFSAQRKSAIEELRKAGFNDYS